LKWFWTKENPNGIPQPSTFDNPKTKKKEWIWDEVHQFMEDYIMANVKPRLMKPEPVAQTANITNDVPDFDNEDDAPF
jgi:hypothetical protein